MRVPGAVAVFGSSEPVPGDPLYRQAYDVGRALAAAGHTVVTGGYGGVMEGASRGAVEAGGHTVGVTCGIFDLRPPNPYLRERVATADLHDRTRELIRRSKAFVVLEGKAGTLAELTFLWALARAGCLDGSPVILLGARWSRLIRLLEQDGWLERSQLETTHLVDDPQAAVKRIERTTHGGPVTNQAETE